MKKLCSTLCYDGSDGSYETALTVEVIAAPVLSAKKDTGTALIFTLPDGQEISFWLMQDGTLHWKTPANTYIFEKVE